MLGRKKSKNIFCGFRSLNLDLVWGRLMYEKISILAGLQAHKTHMAIFDDLRPLCFPEGSIGHFWPKNEKNTIFWKKTQSHV